MRRRKLLLHRAEIESLRKAVEQQGQTVIPLKLYFASGHAKLLIGLSTGALLYAYLLLAGRSERRRTLPKGVRAP